MVLHVGANQYTGPAYSIKACFMAVGNITTTVNKGRQAGRQAGPMSGLFLFMSLERSQFQAILGGDLEPGRLLMNAKARIRWNGINFTKY